MERVWQKAKRRLAPGTPRHVASMCSARVGHCCATARQLVNLRVASTAGSGSRFGARFGAHRVIPITSANIYAPNPGRLVLVLVPVSCPTLGQQGKLPPPVPCNQSDHGIGAKRALAL